MKNSIIFYFNNNAIKYIQFNKLPYLKVKILEKSKEYFNDDDPCIIHSTYCLNMLAIELSNKIKDCESFGIYSVSQLPPFILEYIKIENNVNFIEIRRDLL